MLEQTMSAGAPTIALPPLRQDLALHPAAPSFDGAPAWNLHDPAANRFYRIDWAAFEILSRWHLGDPSAIAAAVTGETALVLGEREVAELAAMLAASHLVDAVSGKDTQRLVAETRAANKHWAHRLLEHYLFFRVPLWRPMPFLAACSAWVEWAFSRWFWAGILFCLVVGLFLVSRQWDTFLNSFSAFGQWSGLLGMAAALTLSKVLHEFGHAFAAYRAGCKVPTMGVAFLVMWPMLYTDVNDTWKLRDRRQRMVVGGAGMLTELGVAVLATLAWSFMPDGPLRAATFFLATSTWLITLAINASPFMRFDGYFLLMDLLGIENLHPRAFAMGRWWLRERLFALGDPPPEVFPLALRRFMVAFAAAVWVYRLVVFLSIALLVYYFFFKALGIFLLLVELGWFIARPIAGEFRVWWQRRRSIMKHPHAWISLAVLAALAWLSTLPVAEKVRAPAMFSIASRQEVFAPAGGILVEEWVRPGQHVKRGDPLARLQSPDLEHQLQQAQRGQEPLRWQVERQGLDERLREQGATLPSRLSKAGESVHGLSREKNRLMLNAPIDGILLERNDQISKDGWVAAKEWLYFIGAREPGRVEAYIGDDALERVQLGMKARFVPESLNWPPVACTVQEIDRVNVGSLDKPALASTYGGPIAVKADNRAGLIPVAATFRIRLGDCPNLDAPVELRGTVLIETAWVNPLQLFGRRALAVLNRELGF